VPNTDPNAPFGRIITPRDVENQVILALQTWVPTYIAEVERQSGLAPHTIPPPPDENLSYRAGFDFETWEQAWSPVFIAHITPQGEPERQYGNGTYLQPFKIDIAVNFVVTNEVVALAPAQGGLIEDSARHYAGLLGTAACAGILQHGRMGTWDDGSPFSLKTVMTQYPNTVFPYPENRRICRTVFSVLTLVDYVVAEGYGPAQVPFNPYEDLPDYPVVEDVNVTLKSVSPGGSV
jgi:hypothetical protein